MAVRLCIFDLDGTILNTLSDLQISVNFALTKQGFPPRSEDEIRSFLGNGMHKLIERSVPDNTPLNIMLTVFDSFNAHYKCHCSDHTVPYPHIADLLRILAANGIQTAVVSNKSEYGVRILIEQFFPGLFRHIVGVNDDILPKPSPCGVLRVLNLSGISAADSLYIGDSEVDIETARRAGLRCVSVTWGFRSREVLSGYHPFAMIDQTMDLLPYLANEQPIAYEL